MFNVTQFNVGRIRLLALCVLLQVGLHQSYALFGDDDYWKAQKSIDCSQETLPPKYSCDGIVHCNDESDEENCPECQKKAFHCTNNRCIPNYGKCDGHDDCWDGSDEQDCNNWSSPFSKFIDVPVTIEHIDAINYQKLNYSSESVVTKVDFRFKMIAFKTDMPEKPLNGETVIFQHMKKVIFYIPGFMTDDFEDGLTMKNALVKGTDDVDCVVLFDWRKGSYYDHGMEGGLPWKNAVDYFNIVTFNIPFVSNTLADFVQRKIPNHVRVHFIGFSLGGQVSGIAARTLKKNNLRTIDRISAIDPAGPIFEYTLNHFVLPPYSHFILRKTDATFVDVIHGYWLLGMQKEAGHLDVYIKDIECQIPYCMHQKAFEVYITSITTCSQITCPYSNFTSSLKCNDLSSLGSLGYLADLYSGRGKHKIVFYKNENGKKISTGNCSDYLNLKLPAKQRVCRSTIDCGIKPYLSECQIPCTDSTKTVLVCGLNDTSAGDGTNSSSSKIVRPITDPKVSWNNAINRQNCGKPLSCNIENYVPVQYYVAYKKPNSLDYFYISRSANGKSVTEQTGSVPISSPDSIFGQTLAPIYDNTNSIAYIMWNDDVPLDNKKLLNSTIESINVPEVSPLSYGYSKGVFAYNQNGRFLMSHSIPKFPPNPENASYEYPKSGKKFAHMAICVTGQQNSKNVRNEIEALLDLMINFKPQIYASKFLFDDQLIGIRDKLQKLIYPGEKKLSQPIFNNITYGQSFIKLHSFGQSDYKNFQDSFENLAINYNTTIFVKTSSEKSNTLPFNNCNNRTNVENIISIQHLSKENNSFVQWNRMADSSIWVISQRLEKILFCAGDLNRERTTAIRGGMFICIQDADLYNKFLSTIHFDFQSC